MRDIRKEIRENLVIREECARQKQISDSAPDDHNHDYAELNEAFRKLLAGRNLA